MATETQDIVLSEEEPKEEIVESEKKVEYSVKSEVISTVKTHETVTLVTEVRSESETVENHVQESTVETTQEVIVVENGKEEEKEEEPKEEESAKPSDNVESPASDEPQQAETNVVTEANVAAEADVVADETPAAESKAEANEPVVEVEEEQPKVILHQLPPVKEIVSRSPQCLALETFILMCEIPYANEYEDKAQDVTKENKGKIPYIVYKKDKVEGLKNCIDFLMKEFAVETDKHLSPPDLAVVHAFRTMIEESTYWSLMYYRWVDNYGESKKVFSKLPPVLNVVSPKMFQNKCKKSIESHMIGRYNREELYNIAEQDLYALSYFLGEKPFFLGEQPSSFDAIAFGLLANFEYGALGSPQNTLIQEKLANIREFNERMKTKFWSNWEDICGDEKLQEKPKASLVKRLSFRGNKKSKKPAKEGEKSETTSPNNESKDEANGEEAKENGQESKEKDEEAKENGDAEEPPKENGETEPTGEATSGEDKKEDGDQKGEINGETEPANADKSGGEEKE
ncbi:failed axon connections homolog [Xenia sp. Carnegie-2017]|uniref:failed axon connections homolog n=1 Tax=Xenia sp. Carnegie-2017 TaxID=2897299 RepID=UPI001F03E80B|nr:failed axon connections homolog [Xenia sp. Carnegie-2017]